MIVDEKTFRVLKERVELSYNREGYLVDNSIYGNSNSEGIRIYSNDDTINYVTFKNGTFFCKIKSNGVYGSEQPIKISKILNQLDKDFFHVRERDSGSLIYDEEIKEKVLKRYTEIINTTIKSYKTDNIKLLDNVEDVYMMETAEGCGTLRTSCMQDRDSNYIGHFYEDVVGAQVAAIIEGDKLLSRAIVFHNVFLPDFNMKVSVLNKVYGSEINIQKTINWAKQQGFFVNENNYRFNYEISKEEISTDRYELTINGNFEDEVKNYGLPYLDLLWRMKNIDTLSSFNGVDIQTTSSYYPDIEFCEKCGKTMYFDDSCNCE